MQSLFSYRTSRRKMYGLDINGDDSRKRFSIRFDCRCSKSFQIGRRSDKGNLASPIIFLLLNLQLSSLLSVTCLIQSQLTALDKFSVTKTHFERLLNNKFESFCYYNYSFPLILALRLFPNISLLLPLESVFYLKKKKKNILILRSKSLLM